MDPRECDPPVPLHMAARPLGVWSLARERTHSANLWTIRKKEKRKTSGRKGNSALRIRPQVN